MTFRRAQHPLCGLWPFPVIGRFQDRSDRRFRRRLGEFCFKQGLYGIRQTLIKMIVTGVIRERMSKAEQAVGGLLLF